MVAIIIGIVVWFVTFRFLVGTCGLSAIQPSRGDGRPLEKPARWSWRDDDEDISVLR